MARTPVSKYFVYILKCADGTYYTGSTNNLEKRLIAHNTGKNGAKYTRARRPVHIIHAETLKNKSKAMQREARIKAMTRNQKIELIGQK